jgi:hypothetical protein
MLAALEIRMLGVLAQLAGPTAIIPPAPAPCRRSSPRRVPAPLAPVALANSAGRRSPAGESIVDLARTFGVDGAAPYRVQAAARP